MITLLKHAVEAHQQGKLDTAKPLYESILKESPLQLDSLHGLALIAYHQKDLPNAQRWATHALGVEPNLPALHNTLGIIQKEQGHLPEAMASFQKALQLYPNFPEALYNLGCCHRLKKNYAQAMACFETALQHKPQDAPTWLEVGLTFQDQEQLAKAQNAFSQALKLAPNYVEALHNLGNLYKALKQPQQAESCYQQVLQLNPQYAQAYHGLGTLYLDQEKIDEAETAFHQALTLTPNLPETYNNLGGVYERRLDFEQALACYEKTQALDAEHLHSRWNQALVWLLQANYERGWPAYESRFLLQGREKIPLPYPEWQGEPLQGKTILVVAEQGFGDTFQFLRYLTRLKAQGARVIFACQPELETVLQGSPVVDKLLPKTALPQTTLDADYFIYLLSLPRLFETTLETIPPVSDVLQVDLGKKAYWQQYFRDDPRPKIGITWQSNAQSPTTQARSCPLDSFINLATKFPQYRFVSLQKGAASPHTKQIEDLAGHINNFKDTAAILQHLDLVITIDTAVAHLAGILEKPTWVLLPYLPDWRWLLNRTDSPWYPTAKLFRQPRRADWETVFQSLAETMRLDNSLPYQNQCFPNP